jgi:hypothetical protein
MDLAPERQPGTYVFLNSTSVSASGAFGDRTALTSQPRCARRAPDDDVGEAWACRMCRWWALHNAPRNHHHPCV